MPRKKSNMKNITSDFYYPVIKKCIYVKYVLNTFIKMRFSWQAACNKTALDPIPLMSYKK